MQAFSFPTVGDVITYALGDTLGASNRAPASLKDPALVRRLSIINRIFVNAAYNRDPAEGWEWMEDVVNFATVDDTALNGTITTASISFIVTSSTFLTSTGGRVWLKTDENVVDFIDYTSAVTTTASGASDIDMTHTSGIIGKCYPLPSNYAKVKSLSVGNSEPYVYRKFNGLPFGKHYYTRGAYIVLPEDTGIKDATLWYEKDPTALYTDGSATDLAKSLDIPEDFMTYPIEMLKAYILTITEGKGSANAETAKAEAEKCLSDALNYNVTTTTNTSLHVSY